MEVIYKEEELIIYKEEELIPDFTGEVQNEKVLLSDACKDQVLEPQIVSSVEMPHSASTKQKEPQQYTHPLSKHSSRYIQPNMQGISQPKATSAEEFWSTQEPGIDKVQENSMSL